VKVRHINGHSETARFEVPIDKEAYMNSQQQYGSASTFSKRYAFCNAFGILTGDEDTDANSDTQNSSPSTQRAPQKAINYLLTYQQQKAIFGMLNQKGYSKDQLDSYIERRWKKDSISKLTVLEAEVLIAKIKSLDPTEAMEEIDVDEAERGIKKMNGQRASS
jgi:ERF superfamily